VTVEQTISKQKSKMTSGKQVLGKQMHCYMTCCIELLFRGVSCMH